MRAGTGGWNTCCAVVSHARRSIDTSIVSQSRVQLIQCQCKSRLQIANLGINNAFLIKSTLFTSAILSRHRDSSAANQERVIGRYSKIPLAVYVHQIKAVLMTQNGLIRPQIREITATSVSIDSIYRHQSYTKTAWLSSKFPEMYPDSWIYRGFTSCNFDLWWKQNGG